MKNILLLLLIVSFYRVGAQNAVTGGHNLQVFSSIDNKPVAWASTVFDVSINKGSGEFQIAFPIDNFYIAIANPEMRVTGENRGKVLTLTGVIPIGDVLNNNAAVINMSIELTANFNDINYQTSFTFNIMRLQPQGFSLMATGSLPHSTFGIKSLENATDELGFQFSFTGY